MTRPLAMVLATALVAIGCAGEGDEATAATEDAIVSGTPDGRPIAGKLTREVTLAAAVDGADVYCTVPAGAVSVARYEGGRYRVYLPDRRPCDAARPDSFRGWVPADAVTIEDDAYVGKLRRLEPGPTVDVRMSYAGKEIFCTGGDCLIDEPLYGMNRCLLHPKMHAAVTKAAASLHAKLPGARLAMLDCYRPVYVQYRMASLVSDPTWVAQPTPPRFGGHNGGIAVDVSIVGAGDELLPMGSGFDEFSARSKYAAPNLSPEAKANRKLLRDVLIAAGLKPYDNEWWHFSLDIQAEPLDMAL